MRTNRSAPLGPVIPELAYPDVGAAVQWLVDALGFASASVSGPDTGERQCTIRDPAGHRWTLTQTLHDVAPEEWGGITVDAH